MSAQLRTMAHEGLRLTVYDDATGKPIGPGSAVVGKPTIGYGCLLCAPGGIDAEEAAYLFQRRWDRAARAAASLPQFSTINATHQGVLVEMVYQLGINGVRNFRKMLAALDRRDFERAADEMLDSAWARQTPSRAHQLADILRTSTEDT